MRTAERNAKKIETAMAGVLASGGINRTKQDWVKFEPVGFDMALTGDQEPTAMPMPEPTAEQIAWARGRKEGHDEGRIDAATAGDSNSVSDFCAIVQTTRVNGLRVVPIGINQAEAVMRILWRHGYDVALPL